jgi:hypothetical protein
MPQPVQHKFAGEADNFLAVHNRLTDLAMLMIEARDENWRIRIRTPEQMYGPLLLRKRKVMVAGWSAQMYTAFIGTRGS